MASTTTQQAQGADWWGFTFRVDDVVWVFDSKKAFVRGTVVNVDAVAGTYYVQVGPDDVRKVQDSSAPGRKSASSRTKWKDAVNIPSILPASFQAYRGSLSNNTAQNVADMDHLPLLHEASVLENLESRFYEDNIYTACGPVLIALNPFKWLPALYNEQTMKFTHAAQSSMLPPHPFTQAEIALRKLRQEGENSSIVICGESGAGKTETTKLMLKYLSKISCNKETEDMAERILQSNPVLEAFGNAQTIRNDNSSRFGKFVRMYFGNESNNSAEILQGAHIQNFLLEKGRCVFQQQSECTFHIFYQLLQGGDASLKEELHLHKHSNYEYVNRWNSSHLTAEMQRINEYHNQNAYDRTVEALQYMNFPAHERKYLFRILAAILHLGNVTFYSEGNTALSSGEATWRSKFSVNEDTPIVGDTGTVSLAAELLQVPPDRLYVCLLTKTLKTRDGEVVSPLREHAAKAGRDALAKSLYVNLFEYIVKRVNDTLRPSVQNDEFTKRFIGILDIYGFERLTTNGLDQLFINYANEKLQSLFNTAVFASEKNIYKEEAIDIQVPECPDNNGCVELFDGRKGLFALMHEECLLGTRGSDKNLCNKFIRFCSESKYFEQPKPGKMGDGFIVHHYAGPVQYDCVDFVERNRDTLQEQLKTLMSQSTHSLVSPWYADGETSETTDEPNGRVRRQALQETVAMRFKAEMKSLSETIMSTSVEFARCIKTNNDMMPRIVDRMRVLQQLIDSGVIAALSTRRAGYPSRFPFSTFLERYHTIEFKLGLAVGNVNYSEYDKCKTLLDSNFIRSQGITSSMYCVGRTKIFLKAECVAILDATVTRVLSEYVVCIQSAFRRHIWQNRYHNFRESIRKLQAYVRGRRKRKQFSKIILLLQIRYELNRELGESRNFLRENQTLIDEALKTQSSKKKPEIRHIISEAQNVISDLKKLQERAELLLEKHPADNFFSNTVDSAKMEAKELRDSLGKVFSKSHEHLSNLSQAYDEFLEEANQMNEIIFQSRLTLKSAAEAWRRWERSFASVGLVLPVSPHVPNSTEEWWLLVQKLQHLSSSNGETTRSNEDGHKLFYNFARRCANLCSTTEVARNADLAIDESRSLISVCQEQLEKLDNVTKLETELRISFLKLGNISRVLLDAADGKLVKVVQRMRQVSEEVSPIFWQQLDNTVAHTKLFWVLITLQEIYRDLWDGISMLSETKDLVYSLNSSFSELFQEEHSTGTQEVNKPKLVQCFDLSAFVPTSKDQHRSIADYYVDSRLEEVYRVVEAELGKTYVNMELVEVWKHCSDYLNLKEMSSLDNMTCDSISTFLDQGPMGIIHLVASCHEACRACEAVEERSQVLIQTIREHFEAASDSLVLTMDAIGKKAHTVSNEVEEAKSGLSEGNINMVPLLDTGIQDRLKPYEGSFSRIQHRRKEAVLKLENYLRDYNNVEWIESALSRLLDSLADNFDGVYFRQCVLTVDSEHEIERWFSLFNRLLDTVEEGCSTIEYFIEFKKQREAPFLDSLKMHLSQFNDLASSSSTLFRDMRALQLSQKNASIELQEHFETEVNRLFDWDHNLRNIRRIIPDIGLQSIWFLLCKWGISERNDSTKGKSKEDNEDDSDCPVIGLEAACRNVVCYVATVGKKTVESILRKAQEHVDAFSHAAEDLRIHIEETETTRRRFRHQLQRLLDQFQHVQPAYLMLEPVILSTMSDKYEKYHQTCSTAKRYLLKSCLLLNGVFFPLREGYEESDTSELECISTSFGKMCEILENELNYKRTLPEINESHHDTNWLTEYLSDSDSDSMISTDSEESVDVDEVSLGGDENLSKKSLDNLDHDSILSLEGTLRSVFREIQERANSEIQPIPTIDKLVHHSSSHVMESWLATPSQIEHNLSTFECSVNDLQELIAILRDDANNCYDDVSLLQSAITALSKRTHFEPRVDENNLPDPVYAYWHPGWNKECSGFLSLLANYLTYIVQMIDSPKAPAVLAVESNVKDIFTATWRGEKLQYRVLLVGEVALVLKRTLRRKMRYVLKSIHRDTFPRHRYSSDSSAVQERIRKKRAKLNNMRKLYVPMNPIDFPQMVDTDVFRHTVSRIEEITKHPVARKANPAQELAEHCIATSERCITEIPSSRAIETKYDEYVPPVETVCGTPYIRDMTIRYLGVEMKDIEDHNLKRIALELFGVKLKADMIHQKILRMVKPSEVNNDLSSIHARVDELLDACESALSSLASSERLQQNDDQRYQARLDNAKSRYESVRLSMREVIVRKLEAKVRRIRRVGEDAQEEVRNYVQEVQTAINKVFADDSVKKLPILSSELHRSLSLTSRLNEEMESVRDTQQSSFVLVEGFRRLQDIMDALVYCEQAVSEADHETPHTHSGEHSRGFTETSRARFPFVERVEELKKKIKDSDSILRRSEFYGRNETRKVQTDAVLDLEEVDESLHYGVKRSQRMCVLIDKFRREIDEIESIESEEDDKAIRHCKRVSLKPRANGETTLSGSTESADDTSMLSLKDESFAKLSCAVHQQKDKEASAIPSPASLVFAMERYRKFYGDPFEFGFRTGGTKTKTTH